MRYSEISEIMKQGKGVRRAVWPKDDYIYRSPEKVIPVNKWYTHSDGGRPTEAEIERGNVTIEPHTDAYWHGTRIIGISISDDDMQADDWEEMKIGE